MYKRGIKGFNYYVGIDSLAEIATKNDRICVLNVMGSESRTVTPVSHAFSGGNVVCGTSPGRQGQVLKTPVGEIPVFDNVRAALNAGHKFNVGVVYLPPAGVRDGVAELVRVNKEIKKIVIITEKVAVHDAREIRAMCQARGVDVFGANCLGIADSWNRVRIGSAIGGNAPEEVLLKGSVAIYSNSGNFTNTIATYLQMGGWGTTTLISSGKDIYIHFGPAEFAHALGNDDRSKAAVMYIEPGGYYEHGVEFPKPVIACVVGRWKSKLSRAVGHAGALAGAGDDAKAKEQWMMDALGVDGVFCPENPIVSKRGAMVNNIADVPEALTRVMELNGDKPDFAPKGTLALKPWFANAQGIELPSNLNLPIETAPEPYSQRIQELNQQIGAVFPRQVMKDTSGASMMNPFSQVTSVHGVPVLETAQRPLEDAVGLALTRSLPASNEARMIALSVGAQVNLHGTAALTAAQAAREAGNAPNLVLSSAISVVGPKTVSRVQDGVRLFIDRFAKAGIANPAEHSLADVHADLSQDEAVLLSSADKDEQAERLLRAAQARGVKSAFLDFVRGLDGHPTRDGVLAALSASIGWTALMRKRISIQTLVNLPWYLELLGVQIGASTKAESHGVETYCGVPMDRILGEMSLTGLAHLTLMGKEGDASDLTAFQMLLGLLISNGPGAISVQGAKGAVSADGPETRERVQLNKAMVGFLTHTGFAHGGNGFEGIAFLADQFKNAGLENPGVMDRHLDLEGMADTFAKAYAKEKKAAKEIGNTVRAIPGINHPVFKNKPVNVDPREAFIREFLAERGEYNVFLDFYHVLVERLFENGVTRNVFCVNIDAVIAAALLKLFWPRYSAGEISDSEMESAAFTIFLFGRMVGCAADIEDHINRGKNMDTRTPASQCKFVS